MKKQITKTEYYCDICNRKIPSNVAKKEVILFRCHDNSTLNIRKQISPHEIIGADICQKCLDYLGEAIIKSRLDK